MVLEVVRFEALGPALLVEVHEHLLLHLALPEAAVTSKISTGACKSLYQTRPRTVAFSKKICSGRWYAGGGGC